MTYRRLAYDDASTTAEMTADCKAVEARLHQLYVLEHGSLVRLEDYRRESKKPTVRVSEKTARLGASMHLHLD